MTVNKIKVLMVCLGNICRSPTAEVVFRKVVKDHSLEDYIEIDSAGTGDWHVGHAPDSRAIAAAAKRQLDLRPLQARLVTTNDFDKFDYVIAMDKENIKNLCLISPIDKQSKISLFLSHVDGLPIKGYDEVPDPYYSGDDGFELVLDLVEEASHKLINQLIEHHQLTR